MKLKQKFDQIINLQNEFNKVINPDWVSAGYDFDTAILVESVELIDSFSWAWWKSGVDNLQNAKVEVVDILHFLISELIVKDGMHYVPDMLESFSMRCYKWGVPIDSRQYIENVKEFLRFREKLISSPNGNFTRSGANVFIAKLAAPLFNSPEELINMYISKNILNKIRQEFGYKSGTYIKQWGNVEDNVVVMQLATNHSELTFEELLALVREYYVSEILNVRV